MTLKELAGSKWEGKAELWEDPLGNTVQACDCTITVDDGGLSYTWSYQGKPHEGRLEIAGEGSATFRDSWHQQEPQACEPEESWALAAFRYTYMEEWGWRIRVCHRKPTGELVLQMTNVAPWGEEARAVRMVAARVGD
jgi:hypothetical protein